LEELSTGVGSRFPLEGSGKRLSTPVDAIEDPILACFTAGESSDLDAIAERTGLNTARLLPRLFELELQGRVRRTGGGRFVRVDRSC